MHFSIISKVQFRRAMLFCDVPDCDKYEFFLKSNISNLYTFQLFKYKDHVYFKENLY